jgi:hypothetical protein
MFGPQGAVSVRVDWGLLGLGSLLLENRDK